MTNKGELLQSIVDNKENILQESDTGIEPSGKLVSARQVLAENITYKEVEGYLKLVNGLENYKN